MTDGPQFHMIGEPDAMACEDGVCALPNTATGSEPGD